MPEFSTRRFFNFGTLVNTPSLMSVNLLLSLKSMFTTFGSALKRGTRARDVLASDSSSSESFWPAKASGEI